jgi:hypothetical protein
MKTAKLFLLLLICSALSFCSGTKNRNYENESELALSKPVDNNQNSENANNATKELNNKPNSTTPRKSITDLPKQIKSNPQQKMITDLTPEQKNKLDSAYARIMEQDWIYKNLENLTGTERINAANKMVMGFQTLSNDLSFFDTYCPINDKRRETVDKLIQAMKHSGKLK